MTVTVSEALLLRLLLEDRGRITSQNVSLSNTVTTNIGGGFVTKLDDLQLLFVNINVDIAVITKTCLHCDIVSNVLEITA